MGLICFHSLDGDVTSERLTPPGRGVWWSDWLRRRRVSGNAGDAVDRVPLTVTGGAVRHAGLRGNGAVTA